MPITAAEQQGLRQAPAPASLAAPFNPLASTALAHSALQTVKNTLDERPAHSQEPVTTIPQHNAQTP
jgi:hypothetical protein